MRTPIEVVPVADSTTESGGAAELVELERDECVALLRSFTVGRVAIPGSSGAVLVVPVNYVVDGEMIVFRSDPGEKLDHLDGMPASFQIDSIDPVHHTGWSVLVQGTAHRARAAEVEHLDLESWAGGEKAQWVRLLPDAITGRRLVIPNLPLDLRGYR
jgi:nitroimidazol reductase NimA-like FMN-containing flavoprotein (pyridoxamine 5'-phosphate oxidase superfamily)